jgi:glycosyltransferase involved in cell wall biosynthesis
MEPMKVLTAAIRYPPAPGGAETHAHEVAKELVKRGHDVRVYTSDLRREHPFEHLDGPHDLVDGVPVVRKRAYSLGEAFHYPFMPGELEMLRAPADVMHSHSFGYFHTNVLAARRRLRGTPLVITPHFHPPESMQGGWARHKLRRFYDTNLAQWVFDQADAIIAVSRAELGSMAHHIKDMGKVRVIPNGIDPSRFVDLPDPSPFLRMRGIEGPMVLYVGRLAVNKRMELVLNALPELLLEEPDLQLVIAGPDDGAGDAWRAHAQDLGIEKSVRFEGFLSEEDLLAAFTAADVFVLPSDWEAFGIVLLEAMACKTPCICSDRGGQPEVVVDGETGIVAPYAEEGAWKTALLELVGDPERRRRMGEAGRKRAMGEFSWSSIVDRIEMVYAEVTGTA